MTTASVFPCPVPACGGTVELAPDWSPRAGRPFCRACALRAEQAPARLAQIQQLEQRVRELEKLQRTRCAHCAGALRLAPRTLAYCSKRCRSAAYRRREGAAAVFPVKEPIVAFLRQQTAPVPARAIAAAIGRAHKPYVVANTLTELLAEAGVQKVRAPRTGVGQGVKYLYVVAPGGA